jgi:hypothetical protein
MRNIILATALAALVFSAPSVMAGGNSFSDLQQEWASVQARQKAVNQRFAKIDKVAAREINNIPEQERAGLPAGPVKIAGRLFCLDKC